MNADQLLAHYERIADAPDAIMRLRRFILDLAVLGKLVEQDPNDEPAAILLAGGKRCKPQKSRHADTPGWLVFPVGALLEFRYGKGKKASERINEGPVPVFGSNGIVGYCETPLTEAPSIIVGRKGSAGALNLCNGSSWTTDVAYFVEAPNFFDLRYLLIGLQALHLESLGKGVKPGLSRSDVYDLPLSVPPLAEQHRIVDKVDELMVLCNRLEEARTEREETRDRLSVASLDRLNAPDPDLGVFQNHAAFALDNLIPLTTRPDQIKALRQAILNLAVRGKLVPQNPNDEPAAELLKRIESEKARLVKAGVIRRPKVPVLLSGDELPFHLPRAWAWTQIAELGVISPRNDSRDDHVASFVPMPMIPAEYGATNVHEPRQWGEIKKGYTHFAEGDVGLAKITPCFENGKSIVFRNLTGGIGSGTTELHVVCPIFVDADYIVLFLKTPHFIETGIPRMTGTAGQKRVPAEYFANSPFPLPPLAEQHHIVAKVDELMALCDRLKTSLATGDETRRCLFDALLHEALSPNKEEIRQNISTIAQELPDETPGSPKVLTEPTPIRTSLE